MKKIKAIIKKILPPVLTDLYLNRNRFGKFKPWWQKIRHDPGLPPELVAMMDHFITTPAFGDVSEYWSDHLNRRHILQFLNSGYDNFKQTIARKYFTWATWNRSYLFNNLIAETSLDVPLKEVLKKHPHLSLEESVAYNIYTALLFEYIEKEGGIKYLNSLREPAEGNAATITLKNHVVSQDMLNSLIEIMTISKVIDVSKVSSVMEVGAGYGRTAFSFLRLFPNVKYMIVDIPPALYFSQTYLSGVFKDKKVFAFRVFSSFEDVKEEFMKSDLIFITPDQLALLEGYKADLFLAIDCLHEMKREQINNYFDIANSMSRYFYYKCWKDTLMPFDNIRYGKDSYPVKPDWQEIFKKDCHALSAYFEALYKI